MLSVELQRKCKLKDYADDGYRFNDDRDIRATLRDTEVVDDITFVEVRITRFRGSGPFDSE